ncbi:MAG: phosphodiester glycosidase family protein [Anaerolineales bacterium]|nr:phosphodiester glycosidase family protein [Anaerolineales bacterium]
MINRIKLFLIPIILGSLFWIVLPGTARALSVSFSIPAGFNLVLQDNGAELYQKDYVEGSPDYIQIAHLDEGAAIRFLTGPIHDAGIGAGGYGGNNPLIYKQTLQAAWDNLFATSPNAFCLTNGQFFSTNENPTPLAFPLKSGGIIISDGYGLYEYPDQKLMLQVWSDHAEIASLTRDALYGSSAPEILAGLSEDANKGFNDRVGRTFAGVADENGDGKNETIVIFNSKTSRQKDAAQILRDFGASKVIMFDGGGSTQLICRGTSYVKSDRIIPQTIAVISQMPQPFSYSVVQQPEFPILVEGETLLIEISLKNTGSEVWNPGETELVNQQNPWGAAEKQSVPRQIKPGETVTFSWKTQPFKRWGLFTSTWYLQHSGQRFPGEPVRITAVVITKELTDQKVELQEKIEQWLDEQKGDIEQLIREWLEEQIDKAVKGLMDKICPSLAFLPALVLALAAIRRRS